MSLKLMYDEINALEAEKKNLLIKTKTINRRIKEVENGIMKYLETKNQVGFKCGDIAVQVLEVPKTVSKKAKDKIDDAVRILNEAGVRDAEKVLELINDSKKGDPTTIKKLVRKKIT